MTKKKPAKRTPKQKVLSITVFRNIYDGDLVACSDQNGYADYLVDDLRADGYQPVHTLEVPYVPVKSADKLNKTTVEVEL